MKQLFLAFIMIALLSVGSVSAYNSDPRVRVIHASPDAPAVDVLVDGGVAFANAPFTGVTEYAQLDRGIYNVQVVPTGATSPVVIDADLRLNRWRDYTVIAVGTLAGIEPLVLQDRNWAPSSRYAKVRFVHASPDAPPVDIALSNGRVLARSLDFKDASRYIRVPRGEVDLEVRVAGTTQVALEIPDLPLEGRTVYTAAVMGQLEDNSLQAVLAEDATRR